VYPLKTRYYCTLSTDFRGGSTLDRCIARLMSISSDFLYISACSELAIDIVATLFSAMLVGLHGVALFTPELDTGRVYSVVGSV